MQKIELREYQSRAIEMLYAWFGKNKTGHPVLNMPGGSGKSVVIASLVKDALQNWPETRILMIVHSKELIQQNADKLRKLWPNAPLGVYSASIGKRQLGEPITYAGIGSVAKRASQIGHIDLCVIDEVHAVSTTESGIYRKLIADLLEINPAMRMVGLSASPYRLGQGMITEGAEAIFTDILEPVSIGELVEQNYLVPLRSKVTSHKLDTNDLHRRQGEYIASELEDRFNTDYHNGAVVEEIIEKAKDRNHWLIFCSGVSHSEAVAKCLRDAGVAAESLSATHSKSEREKKLADFESGKLRALCNVGILTTGYDFPALDCIAFLRPTLSPGLYLQCAVRGMRIAPDKKDCMVLDFAGNVSRHGPITNVVPPNRKRSEEPGEAPSKTCESCGEIVHASVRVCPACAAAFPVREREPLTLDTSLDIMGLDPREMRLSAWSWALHVSRTSGNEMLRVCYYGEALSDPVVSEYLPLLNFGYAGDRAIRTLAQMARDAYVPMPARPHAVGDTDWLQSVADAMGAATPPERLIYRRDGRFYRVISRHWTQLLSAPRPVIEDCNNDDIPF